MTNQTKFSQSNRIISITELSNLLSKSRVTLWRWERDQILPKPIKVNFRVVGWRESVILEWLETQEIT